MLMGSLSLPVSGRGEGSAFSSRPGRAMRGRRGRCGRGRRPKRLSAQAAGRRGGGRHGDAAGTRVDGDRPVLGGGGSQVRLRARAARERVAKVFTAAARSVALFCGHNGQAPLLFRRLLSSSPWRLSPRGGRASEACERTAHAASVRACSCGRRTGGMPRPRRAATTRRHRRRPRAPRRRL